MKKVISIIAVCLAVCAVVVGGILIFNTSNIKSVEIVGNIQTIYFVDSTNEVNFNDAELKITYKNGNVKLKKLTKKLVDVSNFNTSVMNNGLMKITYKSQTIDVGYNVVCSGLYYISNYTSQVFAGSGVTTTNSPQMVAGVDASNNDITTSTELIYFDKDGTCDYYLKKSGEWFMDDGNFDSNFYYIVVGDTIKVQLGADRVYEFTARVSNDGELSLGTVLKEYAPNSTEFLKNKTEKTFKHYEMKGNRTMSEEIVVCPDNITFEKNSKFSDNNQNIYIKVKFENDNFLKNVNVNFKETMMKSEFSTNFATTPADASVTCFYGGASFKLKYKVI